MEKQESNLVSLVERYHSEEKCRNYLEALRWPDGVICPRCDTRSISRIRKRGQYDCNCCRYQFSVTSGTLFHDSHLPIWKWFATAYLMIESRKGISANQVRRAIGVSYKTAWYLCHRIRAAVAAEELKKWSRVVTANTNRDDGNASVVVCPTQRGGRAILQLVDGTAHTPLHRFVLEIAVTDSGTNYPGVQPAHRLKVAQKARRRMIERRNQKRSRNNTNFESDREIWSLLKRSIFGSYHKLSTKHLDAYFNDFEWRYHNRENPSIFRDLMLKLVTTRSLPYQKLIH